MLTTAANPPRILVVDDEPTIRLGFEYSLRTEDYLVTTAADGYQALDALQEHSFNLITLDLRMPGLDGLEVLSQIRDIRNDEILPVILCSAHINPGALVEALNLNCFDFLSKPTNPTILRDTVAEVLFSPPDNKVSQAMSALRQGRPGEALKYFNAAQDQTSKRVTLLREVARQLTECNSVRKEKLMEHDERFDQLLTK